MHSLNTSCIREKIKLHAILSRVLLRNSKVSVVFVGIALPTSIFVGIFSLLMGPSNDYYYAFGFFSFFVLMLSSIYFWQECSWAKIAIILEKFAKDNGFNFIENIPKPVFSGSIFQFGANEPIRGMVYGEWNKKSFKFFNFRFRKREGRNANLYERGVIVIKMPKELPNIIINSKKNNFVGNADIAGSQKLELEGDFNKYFDVYAPKDYERDLLYFMTPELMSLLVDSAADFDIELVDSELYFYSKSGFRFTEEGVIEEIFNIINAVGGEFIENVALYKDERVAVGENSISSSGKRLKAGLSWLAVLSIILTFISVLISAIST